MNLLQIRTQARKRLGDATSAFWTDDELNGYINDGLRDLSFRTKSIRNNGYITTESCATNTDSKKSNEYSLTENFPNIYSVLEAYYFENEEWIRLDPTQREELDEETLAWRGNVGYTKVTTGTPVSTAIAGMTEASPAVLTTASAPGYVVGDEIVITEIVGMGQPADPAVGTINGNSFFIKTVLTTTTFELEEALGGPDFDTTGFGAYVSGGVSALQNITTEYNFNSKTSTPRCYYWDREEDIIGLDPPPGDDEAGTDYLRVYYADKHTDLTGDSESPTIPEPLHLAAVNYAVAVGCEDRGWGERANDSWTKYFTKIREYKIERNREREDDEIVSMNYRGLLGGS
jgi:hypothetical protein